MELEGVKRKLTTILAADVEGYSRLMSADEEATLRTLKSYREIIDGLIAKHDGRIFGTAGDSVIAEFGSTVEAVRCAITMQEELRIRNAELADARQMKFRIGINVGDVMVEGDNLYGDGVNVAARLEGEAEAGGICISGSTFDQVKNKLSIGFEDIGPQQVKNIAEPIPAFRVVPGPVSVEATAAPAPAKRWRIPAIAAAVVIIAAGGLASWQPWITRVEAANLANMAFPLPDRPSIAVLPFENLSGDAKQDFLSDGISENITTALSRVPEMFVIPRTTTRTYKGKPVAQVAEELGVRYVLEGSVQRSGDQVRVTAQLIDALKGRHIWTERYERETKDTFALQDDIALNVLTALAVKLTDGSGALRGNTKNLEAYQLLRSGRRIFRRLTKESNPEARKLFQEAVELDPEYAIGWFFIGLTHQIAANRRWAEDPAQATARALELAHKALSLDPSSGGPYNLLAIISGQGRRFDEAIAYGEKAVALSPNNAALAATLGRTLIFAGRPEEALPPIQRAKRYSPITPSILSRWEGAAYHTLERYEEAIAAFERARARNPTGVLPLAWLALTYADVGRMDDARAMAQEVLELSPGFSAKGFVNASMAFKDRTRPERALATLRQLGLTKNQPLKLPDKPSIAVLAFQNMSDDPSQEYFADGMAEDIITDLSKLSALFVIARNSSFQYKGRAVDVKQVGRELGVRYVVEGSVRRSGNQVRITAQLIDSETGGHVWAERYDGSLDDVFALQDKVTGQIIDALRLELTPSERLAVDARGTDISAAYDAYLRGLGLLAERKNLDTEGNAAAQATFEEAIRLDPGYAQAYAGLSWAKWLYVATINNYASKDEAFNLAEKSLALNDNALARRTLAKKYFAPLGLYGSTNKSADLAVVELEAAKRLQPNDPDVLADLATALSFAGRPGDALTLIQKAMELNPSHPDWYFAASGIAYLLTDETELAIRDLQRWSEAAQSWSVPYAFLASAYGLAGQAEAAKTALERHRHLLRGAKRSAYAMKRQWPMAPTEEEIFFRGLESAGAFE